jgi:hypothetical protein
MRDVNESGAQVTPQLFEFSGALLRRAGRPRFDAPENEERDGGNREHDHYKCDWPRNAS